MKLDDLIKWVGGGLAFLLAGTFGIATWIAVKVWDMNPKVASTAERVDRIVDVLPEMKVKIAEEDLRKRIRMAILTTEPTVTDSLIQSSIYLLNLQKQILEKYTVKLNGVDDKTYAYIVSGLVNSEKGSKLTFEEIESASSATKKFTPIPEYVDACNSFVLHRPIDLYSEKLERVLGRKSVKTRIKMSSSEWEAIYSKIRDEKDLNQL